MTSADEITNNDELTLKTTSEPSNLAPARLAIEAFAKRHGFDDAAVGQIGLCVNEAMANVIRHAYGGQAGKPIELRAAAEAAALRMDLRDWGNGINPAALPPKPKDPLKPGGLGLICLQKMMDEVHFEPQSDGMRLTMIKKRTS